MKVLVSDNTLDWLKQEMLQWLHWFGQWTDNLQHIEIFLGLNSFQNNLKQQKMFSLKLCMANK
jgi:hypothetical protein